jgi:protein involved in polysaccharide export with SLBB domain
VPHGTVEAGPPVLVPHGTVEAGPPVLPPHGPAGLPHPPDEPREFAKRALSAYIIEPPDILLVQATSAITLPNLAVSGPHLVRPDGTIGLGAYGSVFVAGRTLEEARDAVARLLQTRVKKRKKDGNGKEKDTGESFTVEEIKAELQVDIAAYNSKFYYIITDGAGYGEQVYRASITGNETVLDAVALIQGLPPQSSKKHVWIARATPEGAPHILRVDWNGIAQKGLAVTNYQLYPGDRVYVQSDKLLRIDTWLSKFLAPIERSLGVTLLGSSTVNSIRNRGTTGGGLGTGIR